ncbi:MAG: hypothetical protein ABW178_00205 [Pseudoxanthomonas sp.]
MSQILQPRLAAAGARITLAWQQDRAWTPAFSQALSAATREACSGLHAVDAEELTYELGLVLLGLGAINAAQLPRISAFLT